MTFSFRDADEEVERKGRQVAWAKRQPSTDNDTLDDDPRTCDSWGNVTGEDDQAFFEAHGMGD